jgi:hypothetical protein
MKRLQPSGREKSIVSIWEWYELEDLLNAWVAAKPSLSGPVGDFKGALHLRHWLAHGRYWHQIFARDYSPGDVFDICFALQEGIGE